MVCDLVMPAETIRAFAIVLPSRAKASGDGTSESGESSDKRSSSSSSNSSSGQGDSEVDAVMVKAVESGGDDDDVQIPGVGSAKGHCRPSGRDKWVVEGIQILHKQK